MRLSAFIHDTLYEIALGVSLGRARSRDLVAVSPGLIDGEDVSEKTYVDFDVAVVVGENDTTTKSGDGKAAAEIQVASIVKANIGAGGSLEAISKTSTEQTHRITFKIPIYMNAHFRNNPLASDEAKGILAAHGLKEATHKVIRE